MITILKQIANKYGKDLFNIWQSFRIIRFHEQSRVILCPGPFSSTRNRRYIKRQC